MNKGLRRLGIVVVIIGVCTAISGSLSCGIIGLNEGHWLEMLRAVAVTVIGGLLCWAGSEIMGLARSK
ncbi:MAG: hypothetical protein JW874_13065 [Spirochaetales bacterium]|nr:hypothetical protein [Spirochaetales bacterium]